MRRLRLVLLAAVVAQHALAARAARARAPLQQEGCSTASAPPLLCQWGDAPFSCDFARSQIRPYLSVFAKRPFAMSGENTGILSGFFLWCLVRALRPKHIVESGVRYGLGTWLLRQAAPDAQLILMDPIKPHKWVDTKPDTRYYFGFTLWKDFNTFDWECLKLDKERTLLFFDDHQSQCESTRTASLPTPSIQALQSVSSRPKRDPRAHAAGGRPAGSGGLRSRLPPRLLRRQLSIGGCRRVLHGQNGVRRLARSRRGRRWPPPPARPAAQLPLRQRHGPERQRRLAR